MIQLRSFLADGWRSGSTPGETLIDPVTGAALGQASSEGLDLGAALLHARRVGAPALQRMTYKERAALLAKIAAVLTVGREEYLRISLENSGSTAADAAVDVDGAIFTLKYFARIGAALSAERFLTDGAAESLSKDGSFQARHFLLPLRGVAILINAFNFPAWGLWEKAAPALLSGMPVLAKPATATALLTQRMVSDVIAADVLPRGALSLLCGGARDLLDHVRSDDVISFTGSADTARRIRSHRAVTEQAARINVEADSLNCALLGPEAMPGSPEFDLFVREVVREMSVKAGQKCTAIRRALVPSGVLHSAADAIAERLAGVVVGNPRNAAVAMGPVINKAQQQHALEGIALLQSEARVVFGDACDFAPLDADRELACFVPPTLLACDAPQAAREVHRVEIFGPVATLIPYRQADEAFELAALGGGSLVGSIFTADEEFALEATQALAATHGRILCVHESIGRSHTGHGNVLPMCLHGGPGRAGGGEELGGLRALAFFHRRSVVQSSLARLDSFSLRAEPTPRSA